jgi:hypothetical protein
VFFLPRSSRNGFRFDGRLAFHDTEATESAVAIEYQVSFALCNTGTLRDSRDTIEKLSNRHAKQSTEMSRKTKPSGLGTPRDEF